MIKGEFDKLKELVQDNICAEHHQALTICWAPDGNTFALRCGAGHYAESIIARSDMIPMIKRGELYPEEKITAFLPRVDLGTGSPLTPEQQSLVIAYAKKYRLDPYRGHVVLMYGQPYIGLDGYIWYAHQRGLSVNSRPRPMTPEERKEYQITDNDFAWICTGSVNAIPVDTPGIGIVRAEELAEEAKGKPGQLRYPVAAKHPQLLAQKRAEWQWYRRVLPIGDTESE